MRQLLTSFSAFLFSIALFSQPKEQLKVMVHPGVELFTIVQYLAGKYPPPNPSLYRNEVDTWFSKYKNHPAVQKVASFEKVYPDLTELGWCTSGFPTIQIFQPDEMSWYKYYGKENVLAYLELCKAFFKDSHFWEFYQQHQDRYTQWGNALKASTDSGKLIHKLQNFYHYNADVHWYICLDPLNNWGSHAIITKILNPPFKDWVVYNTGYFSSKASDSTQPVFGFDNFENLVWHEGSHVYLQSLFDQYASQIDSLAYLFNKEDEGMKRNNIRNWTYCLNENMVRGITAALYKEYRTQRQYKKQLAKELVSDFIYVEDICKWVSEQYLNGGRYSDFKAFFPVLVALLKNKYYQPN